jgi:transposase
MERGSRGASQKACPKGSAHGMGLKQWSHEGVVIDWEKLMPPKGFVVLPRRWVVERSFAWISDNRRMTKDYERLCASSEAFVYAAMNRLMLRRLARA